MRRLDDGKVSLVEFLRSIKFAQQANAGRNYQVCSDLASFNPRARSGGQLSVEDSQLIRSAN